MIGSLILRNRWYNYVFVNYLDNSLKIKQLFTLLCINIHNRYRLKMSAEKMEKVLIEAKDKLTQLGIEEQLVSEIEWCLGSYAHDHNASGLFEKGAEAIEALESFKKDNPRKVSKKLIDELTKAVSAQ
tara:strand:+ start:2763 stop:3146 length:384 start_codon:yes stop_codon:yes gene_type:complete